MKLTKKQKDVLDSIAIIGAWLCLVAMGGLTFIVLLLY